MHEHLYNFEHLHSICAAVRIVQLRLKCECIEIWNEFSRLTDQCRNPYLTRNEKKITERVKIF